MNNLDIQAEISLTAYNKSGLGSISTVPEPASFCWMVFGLVAISLAYQRQICMRPVAKIYRVA